MARHRRADEAAAQHAGLPGAGVIEGTGLARRHALLAASELDLEVPCTYDLEVASARYLQGLDDGTVPLLLLFSGTVFTARDGRLSVAPIPWSTEASYRMPVSVWQDVVDLHFPGSAWLRCSRETLDALSAFKAERALPTWDATLAALLSAARLSDTRPGGVA